MHSKLYINFTLTLPHLFVGTVPGHTAFSSTLFLFLVVVQGSSLIFKLG